MVNWDVISILFRTTLYEGKHANDLLLVLFPLLCGVDVSYETPPFSTVLRVLS